MVKRLYIGIMNIYTSLRRCRRAHKPCSTPHVFIFPKVSYGFSLVVWKEKNRYGRGIEARTRRRTRVYLWGG